MSNNSENVSNTVVNAITTCSNAITTITEAAAATTITTIIIINIYYRGFNNIITRRCFGALADGLLGARHALGGHNPPSCKRVEFDGMRLELS